MLYDTHCHINFKAFAKDGDEVIRRALDNNIGMIIVGSQYSTSERAVEYANKYSHEPVYAAAGLHPIHLVEMAVEEEGEKFVSRAEKFDREKYRELVFTSNKIVAIGECGLDYYRLPENIEFELIKNLQQQVFREQIELAMELNLPLILHCRGSENNPEDAYREMIEILQEYPPARGVIHCFSSTDKIAEQFLNLGFYIGFTGIITFKKRGDLREIIKKIPPDKILVETDAPYLAPEPRRGERNEPLFVKYVAEEIIRLKIGVTTEDDFERNFQRLFMESHFIR